MYILSFYKCQWLLRISVTHSSNTSMKTNNDDNNYYVHIHTHAHYVTVEVCTLHYTLPVEISTTKVAVLDG